MNSPWKNRRATLAAAAVCTTLIAALGVAGAGADVNPAGGSNFDADAEGWEASAASCSFGESDGGGLCEATGERVAEGGNPGGALRARTTVLANTAGLFTSQHVFRSPSFTLEDAFDAAFTYDRQLVRGALISIGVRAEIAVVLVNETDGTERLIAEDPLGADDGEYANRLFGVPSGVLGRSGTFHLELRVSTGSDSSQEEVLGSADVLIDNVKFVNSDRGDGGPGEGGPGEGGPGEGGGDRPGTAPGGSITLLRKCTIFGTEGDDRIVGTKKTDIICALGGDDVVKSKSGADVVDGANGDDLARGGKKGDLLLGLKGSDRLFGAKGADRVKGGKDRDVLKAGKHNDNISARDGERDLVNGGSGKRNRARTDDKDKVKRVQRLMPREKR